MLVGSGGYKGPPVSREVEIGYEIAPGYRRKGYATAATLLMTQHAFETGLVDAVVAHTVAEENASTRVLQVDRATSSSARCRTPTTEPSGAGSSAPASFDGLHSASCCRAQPLPSGSLK